MTWLISVPDGGAARPVTWRGRRALPAAASFPGLPAGGGGRGGGAGLGDWGESDAGVDVAGGDAL